MKTHHPDCDDKDFDPEGCECMIPSGRDDPESISNLMAEGPPRCRRCGHPFHRHNPCTAVDVTGPGTPKPDARHTGRVTVLCDCRGFIA